MIYKIISSFSVLYILNIIQAFESAKRPFLFQLWNEPRSVVSLFPTMLQSISFFFAGRATEEIQQMRSLVLEIIIQLFQEKYHISIFQKQVYTNGKLVD